MISDYLTVGRLAWLNLMRVWDDLGDCNMAVPLGVRASADMAAGGEEGR